MRERKKKEKETKREEAEREREREWKKTCLGVILNESENILISVSFTFSCPPSSSSPSFHLLIKRERRWKEKMAREGEERLLSLPSFFFLFFLHSIHLIT